MHARLRGPNNLLMLHQIINITEPYFPCLADEIVEPRLGMNIKVTTFTESKKLYHTPASAFICPYAISTKISCKET